MNFSSDLRKRGSSVLPRTRLSTLEMPTMGPFVSPDCLRYPFHLLNPIFSSLVALDKHSQAHLRVSHRKACSVSWRHVDALVCGWLGVASRNRRLGWTYISRIEVLGEFYAFLEQCELRSYMRDITPTSPAGLMASPAKESLLVQNGAGFA